MNKKPYQSPMIKKVELEVKSSVLAACRTSTSYNWSGARNCKVWLSFCWGPF